ncbi:MAG: LPS assembly protein LptD [Candidatus Alcyoniella australis]|nr:LPS assembly protein LptD [Candidatus Alcyoniella australis]
MRLCRALLLGLLIACLLAGAAAAQDESDQEQPDQEQVDQEQSGETPGFEQLVARGREEQKVVVSAEMITVDSENELYKAFGNVVLIYGEQILMAKMVSLDMCNSEAVAVGDVRLIDPEGEITAERVALNFERETGYLFSGRFIIRKEQATYFIEGEQIEKIGPDRYLIHNGSYTTCQCEEDDELLDWKIEGKDLDVTIDGYARIHDARFSYLDLPLFWTPYAVVPVKVTRQSGFLPPYLGFSDRSGYFLELPFFWAISQRADATFYSEYLERRGFKPGIEYRWALSEGGKGQVNLDFIDDREYGARRWAMRGEQTQRITRTFNVRSKLLEVSDDQYIGDFSRDFSGLRYDRYLRSNMIVDKRWDRFSLNTDFQHYNDLTRADDSSTWQRLPQVSFSAINRPIWKLPMLLRAGTVATNFYRNKISDEEKLLDPQKKLFLSGGRRIEAVPEMLLPLHYRNWFQFVPTIAWRETLYHVPEREELWLTRELWRTRTDLTTTLERVYDMDLQVMPALKHSIEPLLAYEFQPEPADQDELPVFDGSDRLSKRNAIIYGVTNRLWARLYLSKRKTFASLRLIQLRVWQEYDIEETRRELLETVEDQEPDERRPLSDVMSQLEVKFSLGRFLNKIYILQDLNYGVYDQWLTRYNVLGGFETVGRSGAVLEYRYRRGPDGKASIESLGGNTRLNLAESFSLTYATKYNFLDDQFIENIYGVEFHSLQRCWNFTLLIEDKSNPRELVTRFIIDLTGLIEFKGSW